MKAKYQLIDDYVKELRINSFFSSCSEAGLFKIANILADELLSKHLVGDNLSFGEMVRLGLIEVEVDNPGWGLTHHGPFKYTGKLKNIYNNCIIE